ncbi:MAG: hypothetical protein F7B06_07495 [Opitutae bacterium]|nr:hypothetical protein [Opitutae bacterium]
MSERSWENLNGEEQRIVQRATDETMELITTLTQEFEAEIAQRLQAKGMTIVPHHELAIEEFQKAVRDSVKTRFDGKVWPAGLMEEVLAVGRN